jgi:hypothetical protein
MDAVCHPGSLEARTKCVESFASSIEGYPGDIGQNPEWVTACNSFIE